MPCSPLTLSLGCRGRHLVAERDIKQSEVHIQDHGLLRACSQFHLVIQSAVGDDLGPNTKRTAAFLEETLVSEVLCYASQTACSILQ